MTERAPNAAAASANERSRRLRELVGAPGLLVMPGAHDALSARLFASLGFEAIQGTSSGIAASFGLPDGEVLGRGAMVDVVRRMVEAVTVPVNADGEKGYGGPDEVRLTVRALIGAGAAGMNLEDSRPRRPGEPVSLEALEAQLEKVAAVMSVKRDLKSEFFLNARVDAFRLAGDDAARYREAVDRGNAYAAGGADCVFYLNVHDAKTIGSLVRDVDAPVSILATQRSPSLRQLEDLGVARVSFGGALTRAALAGMRDLAEVLLAKRDARELLERAYPSDALDALLEG